MREGDARHGNGGADLDAKDALALLRAWLLAMDLDVDEHKLLTQLQEGELGHADLDRRARRVHERKLAAVVHDTVDEPRAGPAGRRAQRAGAVRRVHARRFRTRRRRHSSGARRPSWRAAREIARGSRWWPTAIGSMHGVTHTIQQIRTHGVRGFDVEVIGTDADVDRRLAAVAEIDVPFYPGLEIGVPTVPAIVDALAEGRYDIVHVCSPGPAGIGAWLLGRVLELPRVGSYHTELARLCRAPHRPSRSSRCSPTADSACSTAPATSCSHRAGRATSGSTSWGSPTTRIRRWDRGVDLKRFDPAPRRRAPAPR